VKSIADPHLHHLAQICDSGTRDSQPLYSCANIPSAQCSHHILGFRVVGTQHELPQIPGHASSLRQRTIEREHVCGNDRSAILHHLSDSCADLVEPTLIGDGVFKRVMVPIDANILKHSLVAQFDNRFAASLKNR